MLIMRCNMNQENSFLSVSQFLPIISSVLFLLLSYAPLDIAFTASIRPMVAMICVFFWVVNRPDLFNLGSVFFLAFVEDILSSAPFGSNILMLLIVYIMVLKFQRFFYAKPFVVFWYGFALFALVALLIKWLVVSVYYSQFLPIISVFFTYLITVAFYPFLSVVNGIIQNYLVSEDE